MREVAASQLLIRAKSAQSYENDVQNMVNSSDHYLENGIVAIGEMMGRLNPYPTLRFIRMPSSRALSHEPPSIMSMMS